MHWGLYFWSSSVRYYHDGAKTLRIPAGVSIMALKSYESLPLMLLLLPVPVTCDHVLGARLGRVQVSAHCSVHRCGLTGAGGVDGREGRVMLGAIPLIID